MVRRSEQTFLQRQRDGQKLNEKMLNITHYQRNANQNYQEVPSYTSQNGHHRKSLQTISAGEGVQEKEPQYTVGWIVDWCNHCGKQYIDRFLRKRNTELPFEPAIPFLGIYPEKTTTCKDTCTPMFIAVLYTIAKTWKQPKCPLTEEWIKKMYIHTMDYYLAIKMKEITAFAAKWMDLEIIMLNEVSQTVRYQHHMLSLTCKI